MARPPVPVFCGSYPEIASSFAEDLVRRRSALSFTERVANPISVLVPSAAAARLIVEELLRREPAGVTGLHIDTFDRYASSVLVANGSAARVATTAERRLALALAMRAIDVDDPLFRSSGMLMMLERTYRDVRDSGKRIDDLQRGVKNHPHRRRFENALTIWREYERIVRDLRSEDPADSLRRAIEAIAAADSLRRYVIFGFYDATQLQQELLQTLVARDAVEAIYFPIRSASSPEYAFATRLIEALGADRAIACAEERRRAHVVMTHAARRNEEIEQVSAAIARLLHEGVGAERIGVVRRNLDASTSLAFDRAAKRLRFNFRHVQSTSLRSTRLGRGVLAMLEVREREFARHVVIDIADAGLRRSLAGIDTSPERLDEVSRKCELVRGRASELAPLVQRSRYADWSSAADYLRLVEFLEKQTAAIPLRARGSVWQRVITDLVALFRVATHRDIATANELDALGARFARFTDRHEFTLQDVIDEISDAQIDEPASSGVWLGDVMHARGRSFEHLFVVGAEDEEFPQRRVDDPLLPDAVRPAFGVREIGDGEDEERLLFALLRDQTTGVVTYSYAIAEATGRIKRPSRFLVRTALELFPDEASAIVSNFTQFISERFGDTAAARLAEIDVTNLNPATARALRQARATRERSVYDGYLPTIDAFDRVVRERLARISPTRLERFGECPQKFLFSSLLDVVELEDPELEIEIELRKKGRLFHEVLEKFYRTVDASVIARIDPEQTALTQELAQRLDMIIDETFSSFDAEHPPINPVMRAIERERARTLLTKFVVADLAELSASGYEPRQFEFRFGEHEHGESSAPAATLTLKDVVMSVRGSIDRVDFHRSDDRVRIVDYKSGRADGHKNLAALIESGRALQLPLYALAWEQIHGTATVEGAIRPIGAPNADAESYSFTLGDLREQLMETLSLFASSILSGHFPAVPGDSCKYCAMNVSCRTYHDAEERLALRSVESTQALLRTLVNE